MAGGFFIRESTPMPTFFPSDSETDVDESWLPEVRFLGYRKGYAMAPKVKKAWVGKGTFPWVKLPAELRVQVYHQLLPHDLTISFKKEGNHKNKQDWPITAVPKTGGPDVVPGRLGFLSQNGKKMPNDYPTVETQLFRVSKEMSREARAVLYGSNTYRFTVDGEAHKPLSLRSPLIFGPFGCEAGFPLLRELRSITIEIKQTLGDYMDMKRKRARLDYFVEVLKEHADDEKQKSLLQELNVEINDSILATCGSPPAIIVEETPFVLESLVSLQGIEDVKLTGLPDWYAKCLKLCIQGKDGEVQKMDWPLHEVKHRARAGRFGKKQKSWITTREWFQPTLDWKEFAQRNDVPLPDDYDWSFPRHNYSLLW